MLMSTKDAEYESQGKREAAERRRDLVAARRRELGAARRRKFVAELPPGTRRGSPPGSRRRAQTGNSSLRAARISSPRADGRSLRHPLDLAAASPPDVRRGFATPAALKKAVGALPPVWPSAQNLSCACVPSRHNSLRLSTRITLNARKRFAPVSR